LKNYLFIIFRPIIPLIPQLINSHPRKTIEEIQILKSSTFKILNSYYNNINFLKNHYKHHYKTKVLNVNHVIDLYPKDSTLHLIMLGNFYS